MDGNDGHLRDDLATDRTLLANERTMLAYVRTAIMIAASGGTMLKVFPGQIQAMAGGSLLLVLSVVVAAWGTCRYRAMKKKISAFRRQA
jgi:putative membrane protein